MLAPRFPDDASIWGDVFVVDSFGLWGVCVSIVDGLAGWERRWLGFKVSTLATSRDKIVNGGVIDSQTSRMSAKSISQLVKLFTRGIDASVLCVGKADHFNALAI